MTKGTFLHEMKGRVLNIGSFSLYDKPTILQNWDTNERTQFKNLEDAYENAMIGDRPLKDIVDEAKVTEDLFPGAFLDDSDLIFCSEDELEPDPQYANQ